MDFRSLKYVLEVAEQRSFSKAAEKLIIAQPSLSQYIKSIEEKLGVKLFDRNANPIRLTPEGELYVKTAYKILAEWNELDMQLTDITNLQRGRIVLGVSQLRSSFMMAKIIAQFKQRFPHIDIYFVEGTISELEDLMMKGRADMFITTKPYNEVYYDSIKICMEDLLLAVPPGHHLIKKAKQAVEKGQNVLKIFSREPFVLPLPTQRLYYNTLTLCRNAGFEPKVVIQTENIATVVSMVTEGLGCTLLPNTLIKNGNYLHLPECFPLSDPLAQREVVFAYKKGSYMSIAAKKFIELTIKLTEED